MYHMAKLVAGYAERYMHTQVSVLALSSVDKQKNSRSANTFTTNCAIHAG